MKFNFFRNLAAILLVFSSGSVAMATTTWHCQAGPLIKKPLDPSGHWLDQFSMTPKKNGVEINDIVVGKEAHSIYGSMSNDYGQYAQVPQLKGTYHGTITKLKSALAKGTIKYSFTAKSDLSKEFESEVTAYLFFTMTSQTKAKAYMQWFINGLSAQDVYECTR